MRTIGDFMVTRGGSLNPSAFPDEEFELYSIPAHDRGGPEIALGTSIGSTKQIVQPGDVMISKIIPHIRRARVVGPHAGRRQIASGEWIVFRGQNFDANYLRHFLISDGFHGQFMNTVAGIGGSLVRARPAHAKHIVLPLPPLPEQRRIAAILDHVDALRAKRRQVLAHLDSLTQSIFHEMFGTDPGEMRALGDVADFYGGASLPAGEGFSGQAEGTLLMKVSDMNAIGNEDEIRATALWAPGGGPRSATVTQGAIVIPKRGASIATNKKRITTRLTSLDPNLMGVQPRPAALTSRYLYEWFKQFDLSTITSGSAVPQLNKQDLAPLPLPVPPIASQHDFTQRVEAVDNQQAQVRRALGTDDELFASLQSRAFRGELSQP